MPWSFPDTFEVKPVVSADKSWQSDIELKKQFGVALKQNSNPFAAACLVFPKETNKALFASVNWLNDELVKEIKEDKELEPPKKLLDKAEYAAKLLALSEEKISYNGNEVYALEGKDRIATLKLYGETMGYINNKTEINNNINSNNKFMEIKFVEPDKKTDNIKVIEHHEETEEENILENSPIKLKLVG